MKIFITIPHLIQYLCNICIIFAFFHCYSVQGEACDIDPECENHDDYLGEFKSMVVMKMRNSIDRDLVNDPDCIKGRKKTVQVRFK